MCIDLQNKVLNDKGHLHGKNEEFQGALVVDWSRQTSQKGWALIWVLKVGEIF